MEIKSPPICTWTAHFIAHTWRMPEGSSSSSYVRRDMPYFAVTLAFTLGLAEL